MGVVYISAPEMVSALEEYQFGREGVRRDITPSLLTECDLLIIDDLGTEFATNFQGLQFTVCLIPEFHEESRR